MSDTFLEMQDELLREIGLVNNTTARAQIKLYLNRAKRRAWHAKPWRERRAVGTLLTVAPYTTGTVTTDGTTTVTGSGTTWTSAMIGRKFSLGLSQPWYTISDVPSGTELTLDRAVLEDDVSGGTYIVYQDVYDLASDCSKLHRKRLMLMDGSADYPVERMDEAMFIREHNVPRSQSRPDTYRLYTESDADPGSAVARIQLWPVPSQVYAIHYEYLKTCTAMSNDSSSSEVQFRRDLRHLIVAGARADTYRYGREFGRIGEAEAEYRRELTQAWADHGRDGPSVFVRGGVDGGGRRRGHRFRFNVET